MLVEQGAFPQQIKKDARKRPFLMKPPVGPRNELTLGELLALTGFMQTHLLALHLTGITRNKAGL
jgi:hypothetical protein